MRIRMVLCAALAALVLPLAQPAAAAPVEIVGGTSYILPGASPLRPASAFEMPSGGGLAPGDAVQLGGSLVLNQAANVTFSYVGSEANFQNYFRVGGTTTFHNFSTTNAARTALFDTGVMDFSFRTVSLLGTTSIANGAAAAGLHTAMALFQIAPNSFYALYNDRWLGDADFDDMIVRIDVAPIPLPAALPLLLAGLGGLGLLAHRRRRAATAA